MHSFCEIWILTPYLSAIALLNYLINSMTPNIEKAQQTNWKVENPESLHKASNSFLVLSLPPTRIDDKMLSRLETHLAAIVDSGASGIIMSITITIPFSGSALWQFPRSCKHFSSSQSWHISYKIIAKCKVMLFDDSNLFITCIACTKNGSCKRIISQVIHDSELLVCDPFFFFFLMSKPKEIYNYEIFLRTPHIINVK